MRFSDLIPGLETWTRSLSDVWPAPLIKAAPWAFPLIESFHLLALAALAGCMLMTCLRLSGLGMNQVSLPAIEKSVRPLLWGALIVLVISGVLMSLVIAPRLYMRPAFLAKMITLAAALVMTFGVIAPIARNDGQITRPTTIMAGVGLAIWLDAIWVFGNSMGSAPGTFHVVLAGWLIVMGFGTRWTRIILGAVTAAIVIGVGVVTYGIYHPLDNYDLVMEINRWTVRIVALIVAGFVLWEFAGPKADNTVAPPLAKLLGLFTILTWVTVAAAGRWIGLGGSG